ncbi:MAG: helix-turn-helix transcriptional regulator [Aerococcus sanguinicola]|uniref:helix-turn-helix domain-containing protein n=1 Tax=Aerococcus sp. HMSC062A02 TaxID=1715105 RepID=UPI0008A251D5|nr:helix-turn-helix transcriptional regulator [Aerococcus sp. HMSC062A02]OFN02602.1 transcriptional regulator [Aerococcus sp. HMSC062A02]
MEKYTLAQWRKLRGMSQEELAFRVGVTARTIANYEKDVTNFGKASYDTVQKLADVLDIKLSQFFLENTSEKPKLHA